jgi:glycosyltransferase involved in cell wall biosynthesis
MKILFISNTSYAFNTGIYQRVSHLLKAVAAIGDVTLVSQVAGGKDWPDREALSSVCGRIFTFPRESLAIQRDLSLSPPIHWAKHKLRYLHPTQSALMQRRRSVEGKALVAELCSQRFDLVWAEGIISMQMLPALLSARVIIDLSDLEHRKLRWQLRLGKVHHMTPLYWLEFLKLRRLEQSLYALPYEFVVCSEIDRKALGAGERVRVIPNGTELPPPALALPEGNREPILLFVGSMFYEPNVDAVRFFTRRVLPLIRREIPGVKFLIVGKDPRPSVRQLHDGKSVIVTGTVPEVAEYLHRAAAVVVPIRFGGGTRIKILEALAYRKAVVSTRVGAEGIDVQSGEHLLLADSPEDFAGACTLLLKDGTLRQRLGEEGFQLVSSRYQWAAIERMVQNVILGAPCPAPAA